MGGADHRTVWFESPHLGLKWAAVLDRLHAADSATTGGLRDATIARGPIRAIPLAGTVVFAQPTYSWRAQGSPTLVRVGLLMDDSVRAGASLAQLAGALPTPTIAAMPSATADLRARAAALYPACVTHCVAAIGWPLAKHSTSSASCLLAVDRDE